MLTRRAFSLAAAAPLAHAAEKPIPILDIHQHTNYSRRSDDALLTHQRTMGISKTILLPAGSKYGLAVEAGGNESVLQFCRRHPKDYAFCANEVPDLPAAKAELEKYLKLGAIGIAEQKFPVDSDSPHIELIASIAAHFHVPVLLHFQHETYNFNYDRFHRILAKFPKVNFIGHAQTFWANISKDADPKVLYPKGKVTPGGITDRLLADYPNFFADLSAGSGFNAFQRDPAHGRDFILRHQDKLIYGSDCNDSLGQGEKCSGAMQLAQMRQLASNNRKILEKLFFRNAQRVFRIKVSS